MSSSSSHILDQQQFATTLDLDDLLSPFDVKLQKCAAGYYRLWRSARPKDFGSLLKTEKDKFEVNLDVQQFTLEEIKVKVGGNGTITVEGKHEEKLDEHGSVWRHFIRKYNVPECYNVKGLICSLSVDGVLNIVAPRSNKIAEERLVPIRATGIPVKPRDVEKIVHVG